MAACSSEAEDAPTEPAAEPASMAMTPDTTGESVVSFIQAENYAANWDRWPGTERLYKGNEPHGMLLTTYVNTVAQGAIDAGSAVLPVGAIVVKENYMPDSSWAATTVMYKVDGYNPEHNDWFFLKLLASGEIEVSGRLAGCQNCHVNAASDYIWTEGLGATP